jgi:hypothetical protein
MMASVQNTDRRPDVAAIFEQQTHETSDSPSFDVLVDVWGILWASYVRSLQGEQGHADPSDSSAA